MASIFTHNGTFTVKSVSTGKHRTFEVRTQSDDASFAPGKRIVSIMVGPDNSNDFRGIGFVTDTAVVCWKKQTAVYGEHCRMLNNLDAHVAAGRIEVLASTRCRKCNRKLTTPESIESGIGPVCGGRVADTGLIDEDINDERAERDAYAYEAAQVEAERANREWAAMKDEFSRREAEQERAAYLAD